MWPFKCKGLIIVECDFPRFHHSDHPFIISGLHDDLRKSFGCCYKIEIKQGRPDKVIVQGCKEGPIKERAIRIEIHKRINKNK